MCCLPESEEKVRKIKKGDMVVACHPASTLKGHNPWSAVFRSGEYVCLAPDPGHKYEAGDLVLPVVLLSAYIGWGKEAHKRALLKPVRVNENGVYFRCGDEPNMMWQSKEVVPITRHGDKILINDSCEMGIRDYQVRYGVQELPEDEDWAEHQDSGVVTQAKIATGSMCRCDLVTKEMRADLGSTHRYNFPRAQRPGEVIDSEFVDFPNDQDIRECCGVWHPRIFGLVSQSVYASDLLSFKDRQDFDERTVDHGRIEPIPGQCIPRAPEPVEVYGFCDRVSFQPDTIQAGGESAAWGVESKPKPSTYPTLLEFLSWPQPAPLKEDPPWWRM